MNSLEELILKRIKTNGPITFSSFMSSVLYDENFGYYSGKTNNHPLGIYGDYYTSPLVHPAFASLLAINIYHLWKAINEPVEFTIVEIGAGNGYLYREIISFYKKNIPSFLSVITYYPVDVFSDKSKDIYDIKEVPKGITGCIISNELIDAFPVNRFIFKDKKIKEIYVDYDYKNNTFIDKINHVSEPEIASRVSPFTKNFDDGYKGEVNLGIGYWADIISSIINSGFVITIDYGYERDELYSSKNNRGSLRSYFQHSLSSNHYSNIGRQDITSHVDFTTVNHSLAVNGFDKLFYITQKKFLEYLGLEFFIRELNQSYKNNEISNNSFNKQIYAINLLVDKNGLGNFHVSIHSKNISKDQKNIVKNQHITYDKSMIYLEQDSDLIYPDLRNSAISFGNENKETQTWKDIFEIK